MNTHAASRLLQDARVLIEAKAYRQARHILMQVLEKGQTREVLHDYALVCLCIGDSDQALRSIDQAISLEPDNIASYCAKIEILKAASHHREVIACAEEILRRSHNNKVAILAKVEALAHLREFELSFREQKNYLRASYDAQAAVIDDLNRVDAEYHFNYVRKRDSEYMDYPAHVQFETYAQCNAACTFCVYPDMGRKGELMPMTLIDKIIGDLQEIPLDVKFQLSPYCVNEPFLDKRIFEVLDKITDKLPNALITLTSNASPITLETLKRLSQYPISFLWLSVVDYRKEVYEEKMKLPFDRLISRLEMIHAAKVEGWFPHKVIVSRLKDNSEHDALYEKFMHTHFPLFEHVLWPYANWLGQTSNPLTSQIANIPCSHWFEIRIDANGVVQHCCMDGHSEYPWGNVKTDSVLGIYNQERYRRLRANTFSRLEVSPCDRCNMR